VGVPARPIHQKASSASTGESSHLEVKITNEG
jgi:hypothetical protein